MLYTNCSGCCFVFSAGENTGTIWKLYTVNYSFCRQVFVQGLRHLNRAVHDDIVAIELFPEEEWRCPSSVILLQEEQKDKEEEEDLENEVRIQNIFESTSSKISYKKNNKCLIFNGYLWIAYPIWHDYATNKNNQWNKQV